MRIRRVHNAGFTLVEIMVVVAVIGILASIAVPTWRRARESAQVNSIGNNLRLLEAAKAQYAMEARLATSTTIGMTDLVPYLRNNELPKPVAEETYSISGGGTIADPIQADFAGTLAGKSPPLTITSFD
jgi:prepilin-type N-terminal cleavage/methylation domain-containing protein